MKTLFFAALVLALPAAAADVSGAWTIAGDVGGNPVNIKCVFAQDGMKVVGTCGNFVVTGDMMGNNITFQHTTQRGLDYRLSYSGRLDAEGSSIKGELVVQGTTGTFSATKTGPLKPEVAGNWTFTGDVVGNAVEMKCALKRDGDKLSGMCSYKGLGDSATSGTVTGDKVTFQNQAQSGQPYDLTYTATLDATATAMKGDIAVAGVTGQFSGTKDK